MQTNRQYIGITGFTTREQVQQMLAHVTTNAQQALMVGVLASSKTLNGEKNSFPVRFPRVEDISNIFTADERVLNVIHYATRAPEALFAQMKELVALAGENLDGFQLNICWPSLEQLTLFREAFEHLKIVLQVGTSAFNIVGNHPRTLALKLAEYDGLVDYVLLDPSGGRGLPMSAAALSSYVLALKKARFPAKIVVAGGLGPSGLHLVETLLREFPDLSIDAEGKLRDENDVFLPDAAAQYLDKAFALYAATHLNKGGS